MKRSDLGCVWVSLLASACAAAPPTLATPAPIVATSPAAPTPTRPAVVASESPRAPEALPKQPEEEPLPPALPSVMPLSGGSASPVDRALAAGDHALDGGDLVVAQRSYESARQLGPTTAAPLVGLARVRINKTDLPLDYAAGKGNADILAARGMLKRAVTLDAAFAPAQLELGRVFLLLGDAPGAMESLRRAVTLAPREAEAHSVLGLALLATGHPADALLELRAAADLDKGSAPRHGNLGTASLMAGEVDAAIHEYELQVRIAHDDARAHSDLGTALLARGDGDLTRAIGELRRAIELDPTRATFHSNLGYALQLKGSIPEAIAEYRVAIAKDPHLASAWINLATALAKSPGTRNEARNALGEARKIDPTDPRVKANEEELDALEHGKTAPE